MRYNSLIFITSLFVIISSCSNNGVKVREPNVFPSQSLLDSNMHKKNFDSLLAIVCEDTSGLDFSEELLASPNFRTIFEHSSAYLEDAISFLSKENFSTIQASTCIFAMQNLSPIDYVDFCRFYLKLYKEKRMSEGMLRQAVLPNFLKSRIIPENYNDSNVVILLHEIGNNGDISQDFKKEIKNVLSGKYEKELDEISSTKR